MNLAKLRSPTKALENLVDPDYTSEPRIVFHPTG
jgi:hypothetical protein